MVRNSLRTGTLLLVVFLMAYCPAHAAQISVQTDRSTIRMNEAFTLTFSAEGSIDSNPDFAPLQQDFEVAGTSQNSSFTIINGQAEARSNWMVTVFPKRSGTLTVPPIGFGADQSPELQLEVQAAADPGVTENKDAFITVETVPNNPYMQAQSLVTVRLYRLPNMANENMSQLEFSSSDVIVHPLDEGQNYETSLYGRHYKVHERRYAVFPQQPGLLRIKPLQYNGVRMSGRRSFFDMDPFGSAGGQPVRIQSEPATLDVRPSAINPWLPSAGLRIEEKWSGDPDNFQVGEPLTRRLHITAIGLTAEQLPEFKTVVPDGFKQYPDQPTLENRKSQNGITGVREESVAFIPTRTGTYKLPAISILWWNTRTQKQEIALVPERTVTVHPAPGGVYTPEPVPQPAQENPGNAEDMPAPAAGTSTATPFWFWLSLCLASGWLLTGFAWWRQSREKRSRATALDKPDLRKAENLLEQACLRNEAEAAKNALLDWARAQWRQHPPQSLEAIVARGQDEALAAQLRALNMRLYSPVASAEAWDGKTLWQAFTEYRKSTEERDAAGKAPSLPPLHKI
jgi:hypothetical protein